MKYQKAIDYLTKVYEHLPPECALEKGGIGEMILANHLGHTVLESDKSEDGIDDEGNLYEYKCSRTNQFCFHFGTRTMQNGMDWREKLNKMDTWHGIWCAYIKGTEILDIAHVDTHKMKKFLLEHFERTSGQQMVINLSMARIKEIANSS